MYFSIVVPLLNERAQLPALLQQLKPLQERRDCEVILVDGGSEDGTAALLSESGFPVVRAPRGRALQMNAGAAQARGECLLFLHADTRLPQGALQKIDRVLADNFHWGRFDVQISGDSPWFPLIARMINWRSRVTGIATGDQAMFVRRELFEALGAFPAQPLMEDIELSKRLRNNSRPACIDARAITSGRRWQSRGVWRTIFLMWRLRFDYWRGVSAENLARRYD